MDEARADVLKTCHFHATVAILVSQLRQLPKLLSGFVELLLQKPCRFCLRHFGMPGNKRRTGRVSDREIFWTQKPPKSTVRHSMSTPCLLPSDYYSNPDRLSRTSHELLNTILPEQTALRLCPEVPLSASTCPPPWMVKPKSTECIRRNYA